jgi:DNA repair protein RecO
LEKLPENKKNEKKEILTLGFLFKLLSQLGYQIETGICINCGKKLVPDNNYFSSLDGGILCINCQKNRERKILIENESIKFLRIFQKNKVMSLTKLSASAERIGNLRAILEDFLQWISK